MLCGAVLAQYERMLQNVVLEAMTGNPVRTRFLSG